MYKKALRQKLNGAVMSEILCAVMLGFVIFAMDGTPVYLIGGVIGAFMILIASGIIRYELDLASVKAQYGDELENDINTCPKQVSGKYFFFDDCFIDLANARMMFYSEMQRVSGIHTHEKVTNDLNVRYAGALIQITMDSGRKYLIADFNKSFAKNSGETLEDYGRFCEYIAEYAPDAVARGSLK
ncbi:MAG: hypothetical protein IKR76_11320 [Ruminococcus sp.]|nr:hypothetical protein [Ruminococcus sp.]